MKKVYTGVDVFKLLAAIGVVSIHTYFPFLEILGRVGVPFFVIISSFLFFKKYYSLELSRRMKRLLRFEKRSFLLLLCWDVIYIPLSIKYIIQNVKLGSIRAVINFVIHYLVYPCPGAVNGWGASWYLISILIAIPFFLLMKRYIKNNKIIGFAVLLIEIYYISATEFFNYTHLNNFGVFSFARILIYVFIGYLISEHYQLVMTCSIHKAFIFMFIMCILFLTENYFIYQMGGVINSEEVITTVPTSVAVSTFSLKWEPKIRTINIRNYSTFLYCIQDWIIYLIWKFLTTNVYLSFILVLFLTLIIFKLYWLIRKNTNFKMLTYLV